MAFDAARTAYRLGGQVTVVCLENEDKTTRDGIPADAEEIEGAIQEGIRIVYSRGVRNIIAENGRFKKIDCPKCVGVFDYKGFNPQFDCADCQDVEGDVLLITIGQMWDGASSRMRAFSTRAGGWPSIPLPAAARCGKRSSSAAT